MRFNQIFLEYDRNKTAQRIGKKLLSNVENDGIFYNKIQELPQQEQIQEILQQLETMDPTVNKQFVMWLAKQYNNRQFRMEDAPRITQVLNLFMDRDVRRDWRRRGLSFDINTYDWRTLRQEITNSAQAGIEPQVTDTENIEYKHKNNMRILYSGPLGQLIIPLTQAASCELGKNTEWCTAWPSEKNQFKNYNKSGPLYVWIDKTGEKYQFHFEESQFMDANDVEIDQQKIKYFRESNPITSKLFKKKEKDMLETMNTRVIVNYAISVLQGRWPEAEPTIASDPDQAYDYARGVLRKRWNGVSADAAESGIASSSYLAYGYSRNVLRKRWDGPHADAAEKTIASSSYLAYAYAHDVLRKRWDGPHAATAEANIANDPRWACDYARHVLRKRWDGPHADTVESGIASSSYLAYAYARYVLRKRWDGPHAATAEESIASDSEQAYAYALDILDKRWNGPSADAAEENIASDPAQAYWYARNVLRKRWDGPHADAAESGIASDLRWAYEYARRVLDKRWVGAHAAAAEKTIASDPLRAYDYAMHVLDKRWDGPSAKTAEKNIMNSSLGQDYKDRFKINPRA